MKTTADHIYQSFEVELAALQNKGQFRSLSTISHRDVTEATVHGKQYLNLSSNDYLGLGANAQLHEEFFRLRSNENLIDTFGLTSSSSRLLTGNVQPYEELENDLAAMYHAEAACVFNSGYHANLGIISALADRHDLVLSDKLNHASIVDGMKLTDAKFLRYHHCDYAHLESLLDAHKNDYRRIFILTESVFSMDGDVADLKRLAALKNAYKAFLIVDDAHAVGVFGKTGCGACEEQGVMSEIDIIVGTFGKALASLGAFAVMPVLVKNYLINTMRPLIFTTALPPIILNWNRFILKKVITMEQERMHLRELSRQFRQQLLARSLKTDGDSQIIPVMVGENQAALQLAEQLRSEGFLVFAIRPPTVPPNTARLRFSLNAAMTWQQIERIPTIIRNSLAQ